MGLFVNRKLQEVKAVYFVDVERVLCFVLDHIKALQDDCSVLQDKGNYPIA